jgi:hypothetical protein
MMCRKSLPARRARAGSLFMHSVGIAFLHSVGIAFLHFVGIAFLHKVQKELSPYL